VQGDVGAAGAAGSAGARGASGVQGVAGADGAFGPTGAEGAQGLQGVQGDVGAAGSQGPIGAEGVTGAAGSTGAPGPQGAAGATGASGTRGDDGASGPAGATGATGAAGPAGTNDLAEVGYVYNLTAETVAIEADIPFDSNGPMTAGVVHAPGSSQITLVNAGTYKVSFSVSGTEPNQMAVFVNGDVVAGSTYGSGAGTQQNNGQATVVVADGDVLTIRNHSSSAAVGLASVIGGTQANVNASVSIERVR
jgi:hypothetical protein